VQAKRFGSLPELIDYYVEPRRGLACPLTFPVQPPQEEPEEESGIYRVYTILRPVSLYLACIILGYAIYPGLVTTVFVRRIYTLFI